MLYQIQSMIRKSMPSDPDPGVDTGFPKRSCAIKMEPQQMPVHDDDLKSTERQIAETQQRIAAQRACIERLRADGTDAGGADKARAEQMLQAFETNLRLFEENKELLTENHKAFMSRSLAAHEDALAQLKNRSRIRELGETLRERLAKLR